ncbi:MAG: hypothetical protein AB1333_01980 [Patescibacteria group bacterium]
MGNLGKILIGIAIVGLFIYGAYYAYTNWWGNESADNAVGKVKGIAVEAVENTKEKLSEVQATTGEKIGTLVKEKTGSIISSIGNSISNFGGSLVGEKINTTSNSSGGGSSINPSPQTVVLSGEVNSTTTQMATGSNFVLPPPFAAIITKINIPLAFSINREVSYSIDWADGTIEKGRVLEGESVLVSHEWKKQGDYTIVFIISDTKESRTYQFPVRVYNG